MTRELAMTVHLDGPRVAPLAKVSRISTSLSCSLRCLLAFCHPELVLDPPTMHNRDGPAERMSHG
jgi:hypothetical protein